MTDLNVNRGQTIQLSAVFYIEAGGTAYDPTTVQLDILKDGSVVYGPYTYAGAGLTRADVGSYFRNFSAGLSETLGLYQAKWTITNGSDTIVGYEPFEVHEVGWIPEGFVPGTPDNYGTLTIGRLSLVEYEVAKQQGGDDRSLSISGQESAPPLSFEQVRNKANDILGLRNAIVPVVATDKDIVNGFYVVDSVDCTFTSYKGQAATADYSINLSRLGTDSELDFESRLIGTSRLTDFAIGADKWHAPPLGSYGYYTGATVPSVLVRDGEDGSLPVYRGVPSNTDPRWGCAAEDYMKFAVELVRTDDTAYVGTDHDIADGWVLRNGFVSISMDTTNPGRLAFSTYVSGYSPAKVFALTINGTKVDSAWNSATLIRNDPEEVVLRLTRNNTPTAPGRSTLDLTLKRGSLAVYAYFQRHASATLGVALGTTEAGTAFTGGIRATSNDANGNRYVLASAKTFTGDTTNGGISKASAIAFDFMFGMEPGGSSAVSGNFAANLLQQYIGAPTERLNPVRR